MTPLDTLRAALELVEQQLAAATPRPWELDGPDYHFYGDDDGDYVNSYLISAGIDRTGVMGGLMPVIPNEENYLQASARVNADAALIVTSVNLLPVVRDILKSAIWRTEQHAGASAFPSDALLLARAILKEPASAG